MHPIRGATRKAAALKERDAIESRIPYASVVVTGASTGAVNVTMDSVHILAARFSGVPQPVDPGDRRFEVTSNGSVGETRTVTIREAAHETVILTLTAASPVPTPTPAAALGDGASNSAQTQAPATRAITGESFPLG